MKTALELVIEKVEKNKKRFDPHKYDKYYKHEELKRAAIFTLTLDNSYYPQSWGMWYLQNCLAEKNDIENLVNAAALIVAEIERKQLNK